MPKIENSISFPVIHARELAELDEASEKVVRRMAGFDGSDGSLSAEDVEAARKSKTFVGPGERATIEAWVGRLNVSATKFEAKKMPDLKAFVRVQTAAATMAVPTGSSFEAEVFSRLATLAGKQGSISSNDIAEQLDAGWTPKERTLLASTLEKMQKENTKPAAVAVDAPLAQYQVKKFTLPGVGVELERFSAYQVLHVDSLPLASMTRKKTLFLKREVQWRVTIPEGVRALVDGDVMKPGTSRMLSKTNDPIDLQIWKEGRPVEAHNLVNLTQTTRTELPQRVPVTNSAGKELKAIMLEWREGYGTRDEPDYCVAMMVPATQKSPPAKSGVAIIDHATGANVSFKPAGYLYRPD